MAKKKSNGHVCQICGKSKGVELISADLVRGSVVSTIKRSFPDWDPSGFICSEDLNRFRNEHVEHILKKEKGEITKIDKEIVKSIKEQELLSENINTEFDKDLTFGQRVSDKIAEFGGSWGFIIIFTVILAMWITVNSIALLSSHFDPYPFILLNLLLSTLAAIQAPIIMMSQNRQESRDRLRSEYDYKVNMKAELEIRHLNEKVDQLLKHQWKRLLEIQQIQIDTMQEIKKGR